MSYLTDGKRLLHDEAVVLAFLPVVNWTYVLWQLDQPDVLAYGTSLGTVVICAAVYNSYLHIDFGSFEPTRYGTFETNEDGVVEKRGKGDVVDGKTLVTVLSLTALWVVLLSVSLGQLVALETPSVWPTVLTGASVLVLSLFGTELILSRWLPPYREDGPGSDIEAPTTVRFVDENAELLVYVVLPSERSEPVVEIVPLKETEIDTSEIPSVERID